MTTCDSKNEHDTFSDSLLDLEVNFQVIKMEGSFFLWIGKDPYFGNLAMALTTKFEKNPLGTHLHGDRNDDFSITLAQKLAKKTGKQVFVSSCLPHDRQLMPLVEKRVAEEMKVNPDKF
ncbi:proteasome assembly chaperone 4-like [Lineus longissimus]|uniref:proteasome assembly chaperone 4-like n=1 Tax=Lineus longissimus TaxID=88925 RepID=UPI002B4EA057